MASNVEMHIDANGETLDNAKIEHGVTLDELGTETAGRNDPKRRKREFRGRQVQMMAISTSNSDIFANEVGMAIGSGLLFDTGGNLYLDGPVSLVLGYVLVGSVMYAVMVYNLLFVI
jgi:amino acid permease